MVAPSLVSWLGLWCRGSLSGPVLHNTTTTTISTSSHHLPPPELMSATYLGLQWPDRADKVDSTTTMISNVKLQKYFHQEKYWNTNILQPFNSCFGPKGINRYSQRNFRDWYKSRLQNKYVKRTAVAGSSHWHVKPEQGIVVGWWREFNLTEWVWCV